MESEKILEFDLSEQRKWSLLPFSLVRLVRSLKQIVAFWALSSEFWWGIRIVLWRDAARGVGRWEIGPS